MLNRLCFVLSCLWALMMLGNYATRVPPSLDRFDALVAALPFVVWLSARLIYRYVVTGTIEPSRSARR